jgi:hypothetical protein
MCADFTGARTGTRPVSCGLLCVLGVWFGECLCFDGDDTASKPMVCGLTRAIVGTDVSPFSSVLGTRKCRGTHILRASQYVKLLIRSQYRFWATTALTIFFNYRCAISQQNFSPTHSLTAFCRLAFTDAVRCPRCLNDQDTTKGDIFFKRQECSQCARATRTNTNTNAQTNLLWTPHLNHPLAQPVAGPNKKT